MQSATVLVGGLLLLLLLLLVLGWAAFRLGRPVAVFTVMALVVGFAVDFAAVSTTYTVAKRTKTTPAYEWSSRYSVLPIMLITAALIVSADAIVRRRMALGGIAPTAREPAWRRAGAVVAAAALTCGLAVGWVTDYRYVAFRSQPSWSGTANRWIGACRRSGTTIVIPAYGHGYARVSCHHIHP